MDVRPMQLALPLPLEKPLEKVAKLKLNQGEKSIFGSSLLGFHLPENPSQLKYISYSFLG